MENKKLILKDLDRAISQVVLKMESIRYGDGVAVQDLDRALDKLQLARLTFERAIGALRV